MDAKPLIIFLVLVIGLASCCSAEPTVSYVEGLVEHPGGRKHGPGGQQGLRVRSLATTFDSAVAIWNSTISDDLMYVEASIAISAASVESVPDHNREVDFKGGPRTEVKVELFEPRRYHISITSEKSGGQFKHASRYIGPPPGFYDRQPGLMGFNVETFLEANERHRTKDVEWFLKRTATLVRMQPGDANDDFQFDQADLVQILDRNKYLTLRPARWGDGDFNRDGLFNQLDIIQAVAADKYLKGPYNAGHTVTIPEPSTLLLLICSVVVVCQL